MKLTPAQRDALLVLGSAPQDKWVQGGKRSSTNDPLPYVNMRAAHALVKLKLAKAEFRDPIFWSLFTHDTRYKITDAGKEWLLDA